MAEEWPEFYPTQCPPEDAAPAVGHYFRLVDDAPPSDEDAMSHLELKCLGLKYKNRNFADDCIASGFSMLDDAEAADRTRKSVGALRRKKIAKVDVTGPGVVKQTGNNPNHHTWWRPVGDDAWDCTVVV